MGLTSINKSRNMRGKKIFSKSCLFFLRILYSSERIYFSNQFLLYYILPRLYSDFYVQGHPMWDFVETKIQKVISVTLPGVPVHVPSATDLLLSQVLEIDSVPSSEVCLGLDSFMTFIMKFVVRLGRQK